MLSIGRVGSAGGASNYFIKDDYYTKADGLGESRWEGKLAEDLGLKEGTYSPGADQREQPASDLAVNSKICEADFKGILQGHINGSERVGRENKQTTEWEHLPGKDLTFSAPKGVSVMALVGGDDRLLELHRASVSAAIGYGERHLAGYQVKTKPENSNVTRLSNGKFGTLVKTGNIVAAVFEHGYNRAGEAHVHSHAIVGNMTYDKGTGKHKALYMTPWFEARLSLSQIYNATLAKGLQKLGYSTEVVDRFGTIDIKGVPQNVIAAHSSRSTEIRESLAEDASWNERQVASLATRPAKPVLDRDEQVKLWQVQAERLGFDAKAAAKTTPFPAINPSTARNRSIAAKQAIEQTTALKTTASHSELAAKILQHPKFTGTIEHAETAIEKATKSNELVAHRAGRDGVSHFTTQEHLKDEIILESLIQADTSERPLRNWNIRLQSRLDAPQVGRNGSEWYLNAGQKAAAKHILTAPGRFIGIQGGAGVGKTTIVATTMDAANSAKRFGMFSHNTEFLGIAPTKGAAREIAGKTGHAPITTQKFLAQYSRYAQGGEATKQELKDFKHTVIISDETSMLSHKDQIALWNIANTLNVRKVVSIGDERQIEGVRAGPSWRKLMEAGIRYAVVTDSVRQKNPQMLAVAKAAGEYDFEKAFEALGSDLKVQKDYIEQAAEVYAARFIQDSKADVALIATDNKTRAKLNTLIRGHLKDAGVLGHADIPHTSLLPVHHDQHSMKMSGSYAKNDTLTFTKTIEGLNISVGETWTIRDVDLEKSALTIGYKGKSQVWSLQPINTQPFVHEQPVSVPLAQGDLIAFREAFTDRNIERHQKATIENVSSSEIAVKLDDGRHIVFDKMSSAARKIDSAHAQTAFASQGQTVKHTDFVAPSNSLASNCETLNVGMSRQEDSLTLWTDNKDDLIKRANDVTSRDQIATHTEDKGKQLSIDFLADRRSVDIDAFNSIKEEADLVYQEAYVERLEERQIEADREVSLDIGR